MSGTAPLFHLLGHCATVKEAVAYLQGRNWDGFQISQLFLADRTGEAVVVGPAGVTPMDGEYLVATNVACTQPLAERRACGRYLQAEAVLQAGPPTVDTCRRALAACHQEGPGTVYSMVYDLAQGRIHLYWFHQFEREKVLNLADCLAAAAGPQPLASLAGEGFAAREAAGAEGSGVLGWLPLWLLFWATTLVAFGCLLLEFRDPAPTLRGLRRSLALLVMLLSMPMLLAAPWLHLLGRMVLAQISGCLTLPLAALLSLGAAGLLAQVLARIRRRAPWKARDLALALAALSLVACLGVLARA